MAIALVQSGIGVVSGSNGNVTPTLPSASTAGTTLIAVLYGSNGGNVITGAPFTAPANWVLAFEFKDASQDDRVSVYYYPSNPGGISSAAFTSSNLGAAGELSEWSGIASSPVDATGSAHVAGTGTSITPSTSTSATAGDLAIAVCGSEDLGFGVTPTITGAVGWTALANGALGDVNGGAWRANYELNVSGTVSEQFTLSNLDVDSTTDALVVTFKAGAVPPTTAWGLWGLVSIILPWVTTHAYTQAVTETVGAAVDAITRVFVGTRTVTETVGAGTDAVTRQVTYVRVVTETVGTATDSVARVRGAVRPVTETVGPGLDSVQRAATASRTATETVGPAADATSRVVTFGRSLAETVGPASDVASRIRGTVRGITETVGAAADSLSRIFTGARTVAETVGAAADTPTRQTAVARSRSETVGPASDATTRLVAFTRAPTESVGPAIDSVTGAKVTNRAVTETVGPAADTPTRQVTAARTVTQTIGAATDAVGRIAAYARGLGESIGPASDVVTDLKAKFVNVIETIGPATDTASRLAAAVRSASETIAAAVDVVSRTFAAVRNPAETVSAADTVTRGVGRQKAISESVGPAADTAAGLVGFHRSPIETVGPATDSITHAFGYNRLLSETVAVTDVASRLVAYRRQATESVGPAIDVVNPQTGHPFLVLEPLVVVGAQNRLWMFGTDMTLRVTGADAPLQDAVVIQVNDFENGGAVVDYAHFLGNETSGTVSLAFTASEGGGLPAPVAHVVTTTARQTSFVGHPDWADITALVRCSFPTGGFTGIAIHSPDGSPINGVRAAISNNVFQLNKGINGINTTVVQHTLTLVAGTQYWIELIAVGNAYAANIYADNAGAKGALIDAIPATVIADAYAVGYMTLQSTLAGGTFGGAFNNVCKVTGPAPLGCTTNLNAANWVQEPVFCWSKVRGRSGVASLSILANGPSNAYWNAPGVTTVVGQQYRFEGWVYLAFVGGAGSGGEVDRSGNPTGNRITTAGSWQSSGLYYIATTTTNRFALLLGQFSGPKTLVYFDDATIFIPAASKLLVTGADNRLQMIGLGTDLRVNSES